MSEKLLPSFQERGVQLSNVPRNRALESAAPVSTGQEIFNILESDAKTQFYVIRANQLGVFPDSEKRDLREKFQVEGKIAGVYLLSEGRTDEAHAYLIGSVTGPYASQLGRNDEWHGMFMVTRGREGVPTFGELDVHEMRRFHSVIGETLAFLDKQDGVDGFVGFSFSPLEGKRIAKIKVAEDKEPVTILFPRSPVQNLATVHAHIVMMKKEYLEPMPDPMPEKFDARMVDEPKLNHLVTLFRDLIYTPVKANYGDLPVQYFEHVAKDAIFPKGIQLVVPESELQNEPFSRFVKDLHEKAVQVYQQIADAVIDYKEMEKGKIVMRPHDEIRQNIEALLARAEYKALPESTQRFLKALGRLKDPNKMVNEEMSIKEMAKTVENFVMLGLAYNAVYYKPEQHPGHISLAIVPRWLTGASPIESLGIYKNQTTVEGLEMQEQFRQLTNNHQVFGNSLADYLKAPKNE